jgi:hypothetical protein
MCSRETPARMSGFWELSPAEVAAIDQALLAYLAGSGLRMRGPAASYQRQYLGFHRDGARMVYVNAFPTFRGRTVPRSRVEFFGFCDGGADFWGIEYDVARKSFARFAVNF